MYRNLYLTKLSLVGIAAAAFFMSLAGTPALAQTASCDDLAGAAFGLCNAYCEAMACGSDNPQASENACMKVKSKFDALELDPLPCLGTGNAAPLLDLDAADTGTVDTTATFVTFGDAVPIAAEVTITDSNGGVITAATVSLPDPPPDGVEETLALTPEGDSLVMVDLLGGDWNFDSATGVLTITVTGLWPSTR